MKHINKHFDKELKGLLKKLADMGSLVKSELSLLNDYCTSFDASILQEISTIEEQTDELEVAIYSKCVRTIALRQPAASDLRLILAISRSLSDLERMGDETLIVANHLKTVGDNAKQHFKSSTKTIQTLIELNIKALKKGLKLYSNYDTETAVKIVSMNSKTYAKIESHLSKSILEVVDTMTKNQDSVEQGISILNALNGINRIGKHTSNIAEQVIYANKGIDARGGNIEQLTDDN